MSANSDPPPPARQPFWKRLRQNLLLSGTVFLLCFVVLEMTLRLMGYGNLEIYQPDAKVFWRLKPNQDCFTKVDHKPVHINSHGHRGPEFSLEKPPGTIRLLSLGDSRTFGWGLTDEETYSRRVQNLLQQYVGAGRKVEVINAGVNAWSFPQMLLDFREHGLEFHPDYVVLGEANTWTQFSEKSSPEFVRKFLRRVWWKNFLRRFAIYHYVVEVKLSSFYQQYRAKFIPVDPQQDPLFKDQQQSDAEAMFRDALDGICAVAQTNHMQPVLVFLPMLGELTTTNRIGVLEAKRAASKKYGAPLVDLTADLRPQGKELYLDADPVHFTAQGNAIIAERLFETLTNMIGK
jgi:lysophospholipase L1-like esterase